MNIAVHNASYLVACEASILCALVSFAVVGEIKRMPARKPLDIEFFPTESCYDIQRAFRYP